MCLYVVGNAFRVIADALGGEVDEETYELSYNADADDVADALTAASDTLGSVSATRTISGKDSLLIWKRCTHSLPVTILKWSIRRYYRTAMMKTTSRGTCSTFFCTAVQ